jgi:hypothetical protein
MTDPTLGPDDVSDEADQADEEQEADETTKG